jgi:hypothetical protein
MSKILICGDIHGRFGYFKRVLEQEKPDLAICLGEWGYWLQCWPDMKAIKPKCPVYWIDGNHERFDMLNRRTSDEIAPNIFYKPRGTVELINGKNVLFMGGAFSIDYKYRTVGFDYFPDDELVTQADINKIPKGVKVDIVCSHTAPNMFSILDPEREKMFPDQSRYYLDIVLKKYQPAQWWMAHWHCHKEDHYKHKNGKVTRWEVLDMIDGAGIGWKVVEW